MHPDGWGVTSSVHATSISTLNRRTRYIIHRELQALLELKKSERLWHIPLLAALCVGIPLLAGLFLGRLTDALLACTGGLVILYIPATPIAARMRTMIICSLGLLISFAVGLAFSFDPLLSALLLGVLSFAIHWLTHRFYKRPPGNFFFIMLLSMGSCMPYQPETIFFKTGMVGLGALLACVLALLYSLLVIRRYPPQQVVIAAEKKIRFAGIFTSSVIGLVMGLSLVTAHLLKLNNPYWVPISCIAVMQGANRRHVMQRSLQRILGTFIGLGFGWLILSFHPTAVTVCLSILVLQFIVEMLIVRHYGLAVIFITPLTLLLAEAGRAMTADPAALISARFIDIVLGSLIGAVGGWVLYHRALQMRATRELRKARVAVLRG